METAAGDNLGSSPLARIRVLELAALGPTPFCGMLLGDMGAEVIRIERMADAGLGVPMPPEFDLRNRNKRSIALDLKSSGGRVALELLIATADVLMEGFRPGVMERLGFGPERCLTLQPRLIYARATGWGQDGPVAPTAGHDINYIAQAGALGLFGAPDAPPTMPLNLLGDYAGGSLYMAFGIVCALRTAERTGRGQVVDAAMIDGVSSLLSVCHGLRQAGELQPRGHNVLDGAAPYYRCYRTKDGGWMSVGAIEAKFYRVLLERLGLGDEALPAQNDRAGWPELGRRLAEAFASRTRAEWEAAFAGSDACVSPVLSLAEATGHPHSRERGMFVELDGVEHPLPAPRLSLTPGGVRSNPPRAGEDTAAILAEIGLSAEA